MRSGMPVFDALQQLEAVAGLMQAPEVPQAFRARAQEERGDGRLLWKIHAVEPA